MSRFVRYELLEKISGSGLSEVWTATGHYPDGGTADVVVKRILSEAVDARLREVLLAEVQEVTRLDHSNIAPVYDCGTLDDSCFLATQRVFGVDLRTLLDASRAAGPVPPRAALHIVSCVLRALDHAHRPRGDSKGILHREVSPGNVLLSLAGEVKLTGFGIANTRSRSGRVRDGGPRYVSPEQARGGKLDGRSDVFSAGLLLHELLTGRPVFPADSPDTWEIPWPSSVNLQVPPELDALVLALCEPELEKRFATGLAAAEAVAAWGLERNLVLRDDAALGELVTSVMPNLPQPSPPRWRILAQPGSNGRSRFVTDAALRPPDPGQDRRVRERVTRESTDPTLAAVFDEGEERTDAHLSLERLVGDVPFDPTEVTREGTVEVIVAAAEAEAERATVVSAPVASPRASEPETRTRVSTLPPVPARIPIVVILGVGVLIACAFVSLAVVAALWVFVA